MNNRKAFSLLEVSFVLLIIGIIVAGITLSTNLIKRSRIASAQALTEKSPIISIQNSALWLETSFSSNVTSSDFNGDEVSDNAKLDGWNDNRKLQDKVEVESVGTGPVYANTINYIPAVKFENSDSNYLQVKDASFLNGSDYTIFVVEKRNVEGGNNFFIGDSSNSSADGSLLLGYSGDSKVIHSHSGLGASNLSSYNSGVSDYGSSEEEARVFAFVHSATEGNLMYVNGVLTSSDSGATGHLTGVTSLAIGKGYSGEVGEVSVFTRALNNTERKSIEDYLGVKWRSVIHRKKNVNSADGPNADLIDCRGYVVTSDGCEMSCAVNVVGVSASAVSNGSSGSFSCNQSGFSGGSVGYSCSNGVLTTSGSCSCASGYSYVDGECLANCSISVAGVSVTEVSPAASATSLSCDASGYSGSVSYTCSSGGSASVSGSCFKNCAVSGVTGVTNTTVTSASGTLSCNSASNYSGSVSYTCTNGVLATSGSCGCATGYSLVGGVCVQGCAVSVTGASTTNVTASSGSFSCDQSGYSGTITYTCNSGTFATNNACAIGSSGSNCTGGTIDTTTVSGDVIHKFTSSGTLTCPTARTAQVLVVAGGGGGGGGGGAAGGAGGGGGGVVYNSSFNLTTSAITVTVGSGGNGGPGNQYNISGVGSNGGNSVFSTITAIGGGGSGAREDSSAAGSTGGSGGGGGVSGTSKNGGSGTSGQGYAGGANWPGGPNYGGGGGGGAGSVGQRGSSTKGGDGGVGISSSITGTATYYGGGGGASYYQTGGTYGAGGLGGGGAVGQQGTDGLGGGGGGGAGQSNSGSKGGSGVVIVRYTSSITASCPSGYAISGSNCVKVCTVSVAGVSSPSSVIIGSGTLTCGASGYTGSVTYNCDSGAVLTTTGSCSCATGYTGTNCGSCDTGYSMISGTCQRSCSTGSTVGINSTTVASGTGTLSCNATNFNTSDSLNYSCSSGTFSVTSGACDTCTSGYTFASSTCYQNCTINSVTGITAGTAVNHGSTSVACNASGYTGTINYTCSNGTFSQTSGSCSVVPVQTNLVLTSGSSYTIPSGYSSAKVWVIGGGGGGAGSVNNDGTSGGGGGAGGVAYKTFVVTSGSQITYSIGSAGSGGSGSANGSAGGATTATYGGVTITANGGGGGYYNSSTAATGGSFSGGDGGATGGGSPARSGDAGGSSGGAIGGVVGLTNGASGGNGVNSADVSGLFTVLTAAGYATTSGGTGANSSGDTPNAKNGGNASGFGCSGGAAGWYGGSGGAGRYGGGGGGAAGFTSNQVGGAGGAGAVVIKLF